MLEHSLYVCCATRFMEVNLEPLLTGFEDVGAVLVLRGVGTDNDRVDAVLPSARARPILAERGLAMDELDVPARDVAGIRAGLSNWLRQHGPFERILFNATGGTKAMSIAAFAAVCEAAPDRHRAFLYESSPCPKVSVFSGGNLEPVSVTRPGLTLAELLALRGYDMLAAEGGRARAERAFARAALTDVLYQEIISDNDKAESGCRVLNRLAVEAGQGDRNAPFPRVVGEDKKDKIIRATKRYRREMQEDFLDLLLGAAGIDAVLDLSGEGAVAVRDLESLDYLNGGWLEEAVYLRARRRLDGVAGTRVELSLRLALSDHRTDSRTEEVRECDVAIMAGGRLHVLECKTGGYSKGQGETGNGLNQEVVNKLGNIRQNLAGPFSVTAILNPRPLQDGNHKAAVTCRKRAQGEGLKVWTGAKMDHQLALTLDSLAVPALGAG